MRDIVQEILHGLTGQSLYLDVVEGRPSSVDSVVVVEAANDDDGPTEGATVGSPAVETNPSTTITAAAGASQADPTALALASSTGVALGRQYLLGDADGDSEWVELVALSGLNATTRTPLLADYASGASFKGTRIAVAVDPTWAANEDNLSNEEDVEPRYRVIWTYTLNGDTKYRRQGAFDLVRYSSQHHVTPLDVDVRFPGWLDRLPVDYRRDQGRAIIGQAWRAIRMDLRADGKLGRWVRNLDVVSELVLCRANLIGVELAALHGEAPSGALDAAQKIWITRYQQLIREPHTTAATNPMGSTREARRQPLFRR